MQLTQTCIIIILHTNGTITMMDSLEERKSA